MEKSAQDLGIRLDLLKVGPVVDLLDSKWKPNLGNLILAAVVFHVA